MKTIQLTQNKIALVDNKDFEKISKFKWFAYKTQGYFYAGRMTSRKLGKRKILQMHSFIMQPTKGKEVDHINGNKLDNQRKNLRICTHAENVRNSTIRKDNTSGYKGVCFYKKNKQWGASISVNSKTIFLGLFMTKEEAYEAYVGACHKYHGNFARVK